MASGYIIASVTVTDPAQYEEYKKWSSEAMRAHGAEVCVRGGKVAVLEGDWNPGRTVVLKFPSFEAARAFHDSARIPQGARRARGRRHHAHGRGRGPVTRTAHPGQSRCTRDARNRRRAIAHTVRRGGCGQCIVFDSCRRLPCKPLMPI
ncbi:hypothetical protein ALISP_6777 [Alicycliphilus sp. B1]|nr:hypothetical protein ALISP_6777 [Alicycliphilus sp. B1]